MNKIEEIIKKVRECKELHVRLQNYKSAICWRDVERKLNNVANGDSLINFFDEFKRSKYENFDEMYNVIKPLERREKLLKIEKTLLKNITI